MNRAGLPIALFTTNQWVTGETLYCARNTIRLLDRFAIDHVQPCLATNRWITAMLVLFRPQIEGLLLHPDHVLAKWDRTHPGRSVLDDEDLDNLVDAHRHDDQIARIEQARRAAARFRKVWKNGPDSP